VAGLLDHLRAQIDADDPAGRPHLPGSENAVQARPVPQFEDGLPRKEFTEAQPVGQRQVLVRRPDRLGHLAHRQRQLVRIDVESLGYVDDNRSPAYGPESRLSFSIRLKSLKRTPTFAAEARWPRFFHPQFPHSFAEGVQRRFPACVLGWFRLALVRLTHAARRRCHRSGSTTVAKQPLGNLVRSLSASTTACSKR
jgi:hypothetical protein